MKYGTKTGDGCVFAPQAWNGPKQGSSGAKTCREDVLFVLVAGSSSHVFEAVAVGTAEGERCRGRRPARWMQRMMQLGLTAEVEGKAREKEAFLVVQQDHSSIGGKDKDNYVLVFFE